MKSGNQAIATLGDKDYYSQAITAHHAFYVDEPEKAGGGNLAPHPRAYLLGALASCTAITIRMYAQRKGWELGQIKVAVNLREKITQDGPRMHIDKQVTFGNPVTEEQRQRLLEIGEKCPVSVMLTGQVTMSFAAVDHLDEGIVKEYRNDELAVVWKPNLCIHSQNCWKGLLTVFNPQKKPWINMHGAPTDRIVEQVKKCPSGALSYYFYGNEDR